MGFLVRNGTSDDTPLLGLQSGTRVPQILDINTNKEGVAIKVSIPDVPAAGTCIRPGWRVVLRH